MEWTAVAGGPAVQWEEGDEGGEEGGSKEGRRRWRREEKERRERGLTRLAAPPKAAHPLKPVTKAGKEGTGRARVR